MPKENDIGYSNCTQDKQDGLRKFIGFHINIVSAVWKNAVSKGYGHPYPYIYIDTNAGDGATRNSEPGSPVIFLQAAMRKNIPFKAFFIERNKANVEKLRTVVSEFNAERNVEIFEGDNAEIIPELINRLNELYKTRKPLYGLLYKDPNGEPNLEMLKAVAVNQKTKYLDLLLRIPTRVLKRKANAPNCGAHRLTEFITEIKKEHWLIREKYVYDKNHDWTFMFGINYRVNGWEKERFYSIGSEIGQKILEELGLTKKEREALHQTSFGWKDAARQRNGGICEMCKEKPATELHHLRYGPERDPRKVIYICHACHCFLEGKLV